MEQNLLLKVNGQTTHNYELTPHPNNKPVCVCERSIVPRIQMQIQTSKMSIVGTQLMLNVNKCFSRTLVSVVIAPVL